MEEAKAQVVPVDRKVWISLLYFPFSCRKSP